MTQGHSIMNPKGKVKLSTPKLSPEIQREVDELQRVFARAQQNLEKLEKKAGKLTEKCVELSTQARKLGNDALRKKGHNVHTHRYILKQYSQSIALAPQDSEELVLGYGNRSSLLMHLQHYEEALVDIDRALQLSKSDDYKKKLQTRKQKCLGLLTDQKMIKSTKYSILTENEELERIRSKLENFKPSSTVPCAADCVGIAYNDQWGRHLAATRDIKPGEIVIVERGYSCSPILNELYLVCSHCLQYAWNGIPCDKCVYAIYCSEDCKNEAFKEYHDIECPMLKYLQHMIFNTENGLNRITTVRLLITALKNEGFENVMKEMTAGRKEGLDGILSDGILRSDKFKTLYNLSHDLKDLGADDDTLEFNSLQILYLLMNRTNFLTVLIGKNPLTDKAMLNPLRPVFQDDESIIVDPRALLKFKEALVELISIAATNGYPIQTGTMQCGYCEDIDVHMKTCQLIRGNAIVPCCSFLNHSCTPNLKYVSTPKRKIIVFSTCPIKKGEMLCVSYKSITMFDGDARTRQMILSRFFICKCRACTDKIDIDEYMNNRDGDVCKIYAELKKKFSTTVAQSYIEQPYDDSQISEKTFREMIKISQLVYKHFNYYKAFANTLKSYVYIEGTMAKIYRDKIYMPNDC